MTNVIDFAAVLNARRAAAQQATIDAAAARRAADERDKIAQSLGGSFGAQLIADVVLEQRERARQHQPMPAYCDPANETRGAKHDATRDLSLAAIATRIRADIKAAGLPKGVKVSVRTRTYSGGGAIDVRITALPADMLVLTDKAASWRKQFGERRDYPFNWAEATSAELQALLDALKRIHGAYNRDNSDSMTDYFDRRYYGGVELEWQLRRDREAAEVAANPGTYWEPDA